MFWSFFEELWKLPFCVKKDTVAKYYSESNFFQQVWKQANPEENFDLMETILFYQTSEMGCLLLKKVFLLKMSHILLN